VNVDYSLDVFAMAAGTNELTKEIVKRKLLICKPYEVDVKQITCLHEVMFHIIEVMA
jgi:hypothetical protein